MKGWCEMIIRSQDKTLIVNLNNIDCIYSNRENKIIVFNGEAQSHIGKYSTEEKAIKVLDMIQKAYNSIETMKIDKGAWRGNHYFEMPQDSEV